jgi:hypothetical protein
LRPGSGYLDLLAGARGSGPDLAAFARSELGWHLGPSGAVFVQGEASKPVDGALSWQAGLGARFTW